MHNIYTVLFAYSLPSNSRLGNLLQILGKSVQSENPKNLIIEDGEGKECFGKKK